MMKNSLKLKLNYNFIFLFIIISNIKGKEEIVIETGKILTKFVNNKNDIELKFNEAKDILVHFLSTECKFKLISKNNININKINHYTYDAFYLIINSTDSNFNLRPLIKGKSENRSYPLIINSIKIDEQNIPELIIKENEPAFLYFNNDLKKINLLYKFQQRNANHPIIVSFFIKENEKFNIEISEGENNIINRYINFKENIIIKPKSSEVNYKISISISSDEEIISSTMIVKIIQSNSSPFYLQKNQLNLGYIPIEVDHYYYYMEVFKGEEGEIMLFNKIQNGILISKIIIKNNETTIQNVTQFPKNNENKILTNEYLDFNIYSQNLRFNSSHTEKCKEGCYLLITYYSNISKSLEIMELNFQY